ncbi:MAG TPA: FAD-binding oxidoreductase [Xanthobacteraceae bacterium]|nr:FAD-binding oxidoreductase [Xanthobacteraceae bacterium]
MSLAVAPRLDRRRFLIGASALSAGLAGSLAAPRFGLAAEDCPEPCPQTCLDAKPGPLGIPACDWNCFKKAMRGPLLWPDDSRYRRFAEPFNLYFDTPERQPDVIAVCAGPDDVVAAVNFARDHGQHPVVRAGGHSYAGYSMGPKLMIDVSLMKQFSYDRAKHEITVQCGARNGDVYNVLRAENRTLTHGRCPTVGIAGFVLGGGIGFNMRHYGVGSDLLRASDIVTADGRLLHLSEHEHSDLFWACRGGGGGNFGINTAFTLETHRVGELAVFHIEWRLSRAAAVKLVAELMQQLDRGDPGLGSRFKFFKDPCGKEGEEAGVDLLGQYQGPLPRLEVHRLLDDILRRYPPAKDKDNKIEAMPYWDGQDFLLDWDGPFRFTERSLFIWRNLRPDEIDDAFDALWEFIPSKNKSFYPDVRFFQTGGAMNEVPADRTAFVHRDSRWLMDFGLPWSAADNPDDDHAWLDSNRKKLNDLFNDMKTKKGPRDDRELGTGSYQNFADPELGTKPAEADYFGTAYYGKNLRRLGRIKQKYDPDNRFKFPQSIPRIA